MCCARASLIFISLSLALSVLSASAATPLNVPKTGSPIDRVDNLWQQTRPILRNDWNATLVDGEAARRRSALTQSWMTLKTELGREQAPPNVRAIIHDVVTLVSRVYSHASGASTASSSSTTSSKVQSPGSGGSVSIDTKLARIDQVIAAARAK